ncbi:MAG: hypothetical protein ABR613_05540 [Actinomycetota bacterium]
MHSTDERPAAAEHGCRSTDPRDHPVLPRLTPPLVRSVVRAARLVARRR